MRFSFFFSFFDKDKPCWDTANKRYACVGCHAKLIGLCHGGATVLSNAPSSASSPPPIPQCCISYKCNATGIQRKKKFVFYRLIHFLR